MRAVLAVVALLLAVGLAACAACRCERAFSRYEVAPFGVFEPLATTVCVASAPAGHKCLVVKPAEPVGGAAGTSYR